MVVAVTVKHTESCTGPLSLLRTPTSAVTPLHKLCLLRSARYL